MVVVGVMIAVDEPVEEVFVADGDVSTAVDVVIGAVDISFAVVCVVKVAGLAVVVFVHGEATKLKQRAKCIQKSDAPLINM